MHHHDDKLPGFSSFSEGTLLGSSSAFLLSGCSLLGISPFSFLGASPFSDVLLASELPTGFGTSLEDPEEVANNRLIPSNRVVASAIRAAPPG